VLVAFSLGAIVKEWAALAEGFTKAGVSVVVFNLLSLALGYLVSHAVMLKESSAIAITFQLGVRSAILSIYIAMTALNNSQMALPAAVYSVTMVFFGVAFGLWVKRLRRFGAATAVA
jgi:BASS family bile acid:Na+ symporter